jgi:Tfp pilus assembly protein PilN
MIKINLIGQRKKNKLPTVLGVDLNTLNFKLIIICYIAGILGESFVKDMINKENQEAEGQIAVLQEQFSKIQEEIKKFENTREELERYNSQVERLRKRSSQVIAIINEKSNPKPALAQVSQFMPADMWLDFLEINSGGKITLRGGSESYVSVGNFIMSANESSIFSNLNLASTNTQEVREGGVTRRLETYTVEGEVKTSLGWTQ